MSVLYWIRLSHHKDIFSQGYVGVTPDFYKRKREHKHRFKSIWHEAIMEKIVIAESSYCYDLENKIRQLRL